MKQMSAKRKIEQGRCQGYGPDYIPFYKANEFSSSGTASIIADPIEGRQVHTMSTVETDFYWNIRWDPEVVHIREQYLLDTDRMNLIREKMGLKKVTGLYYTTDFLVDYADGEIRAYSIKYSRDVFDRSSRRYRGRENKFDSMIVRQRLEKVYWESQGVPFSIVTKEDVDRYKARNVESVMACYQPWRCRTTEQKFRFLIAHRFIDIPMEGRYLNFQREAENAGFDIEWKYEKALEALAKAESDERRLAWNATK